VFFSVILGCSSDIEGTRAPNQSPVVWLAVAPPEGSTTTYRVHLYWGGRDPDGEVAFYEYALADNHGGAFSPADTSGPDAWHMVFRTDSAFVFTADEPEDSTVWDKGYFYPFPFIASHTFFVRAVDDHGACSKPAYRSFTARTLSPEVDIISPGRTGFSAASVPPVTTFSWRGSDLVDDRYESQLPDSSRFILVSTRDFGANWDATLDYIRKNPTAPEWSPWISYTAPHDSGTSWRADPPMDFGDYVFAVQVKDEAGAVSPVFTLNRNARRINVSARLTGPVLTLKSRYIPPVVNSGPQPSRISVSFPAAFPIQFTWSADASSYGGTVGGYRYGWDVEDLNNDADWEVLLTPFVGTWAASPTRLFSGGTHRFTVEVVDNSGFKSRAEVVVNFVPFTMERGVLLVDDWIENSAGFSYTNGATPSDDEHDAFWADMLRDVDGFDAAADMYHLEGASRSLPIEVLGKYRTVIWNARGSFSIDSPATLARYIGFVPEDPSDVDPDIKVEPNLLDFFLAAGGRVLLCGEHIMTNVINREYFSPRNAVFPLIFRYELQGDQDGIYEDSNIGVHGVGESSFAYSSCCLNAIDIAYVSNPGLVRRFEGDLGAQACPVADIRDHSPTGDGLRMCRAVDAAHAFPNLELRPEVAGPGKWYRPESVGLNTEIYNPPYFGELCPATTEFDPPRSCFEPMYSLVCSNPSSVIQGAPVGFWASADGGPRSAVWGFEPVYFKPDQVRSALEIILFDEWQLPRR